MMRGFDERNLIDKLKEQGWEITRTTRGVKAKPPDKTKPLVHFSEFKEYHAFRNTLAELRKSGFIWEEEPASKRMSTIGRNEHIEPPLSPTPVPKQRESFPDALRRLRTRENISIASLASLIGVTGQAVGQWELGIDTPVLENYEKLLDLLPELRFAPEPDSKDIPKPKGRGEENGEQSYYCDLTELETKNEEPPTETSMNVPNAAPVAASTAAASLPHFIGKGLVIEFIRIARRLNTDENLTEFLELLRQADNAGMTIHDVLEMFS